MGKAKHGARALERHLRNQSLDGRTRSAKLLAEIGDALADDRGGWPNVSAAERLLIERCAAETLFLRRIEGWVLQQPEIIVNNGDGPRLLGPLAKGYTSHLGALTRALSALGIRPDKVERLPSLADYLADRDQTASNGVAPHSSAPSHPKPTSDVHTCGDDQADEAPQRTGDRE